MSGVSGAEMEKNRNATWSFWLGLISFLWLGPILGIPAIIVGNKAKREIRESGGAVRNASQATLGVVFGWITTIIWVIGWVILAITYVG